MAAAFFIILSVLCSTVGLAYHNVTTNVWADEEKQKDGAAAFEEHHDVSNQRGMLETSKPNLLFIMTDQQRFDALRRAQDEIPKYRGKLKIQTPNLDRIAETGVYFRKAYCGCPSCAPSRAILRTGNTMERTGIKVNKMSKINKLKIFRERAEALETYDDLLVENQGYVAETYGKWHLPLQLYKGITYNDYDFKRTEFLFENTVLWGSYKNTLKYLTKANNITSGEFQKGQQKSPSSQLPYDPVKIDSRYGKPTNSPQVTGVPSKVVGIDSLPANFSRVGILGETALRAIDRLAGSKKGKPFSLTVSFTSPHPPMIVAPDYSNHYYKNRRKLLLPPSLKDPMKNSAYASSDRRKPSQFTPVKVRDWTAVYYALVAEIDTWVGRMLDKLEELDVRDNTMVVFTSDHGEMLGAHGMDGKSKFLEEAMRVPLLMSFPLRIAPKTTVKEPVAHMDVFATILDYLGAPYLDKSDGKSLRRFIEKTNYNKRFDNEVVVAERDAWYPEQDGQTKKLGSQPNYMIRRGRYKLMVPKKADSTVLDMMYDLGSDPYEMNNLLGKRGSKASHIVVGKAEHLKVLLLEWMRRHNGKKKYYSDNKWNFGQGRGDIKEIRKRRTWKTVSFWLSDNTLKFGKPALVDGIYLRNEYLYMGRTDPGVIQIRKIYVTGPDARYFKVSKKRAHIKQNEYLMVRVQFRSKKSISIKSLNAKIVIILGNGKDYTVDIQ